MVVKFKTLRYRVAGINVKEKIVVLCIVKTTMSFSAYLISNLYLCLEKS